MGDNWETSIKSCGQRTQSIQSLLGDKHSEHPELTGRQVGDKCEIMRPALRAYWETSGKQMGHKYKIMRPEHSEHPGLTRRQVGDKCEIMRPEHSEHPELTWRQVGDKWETSVKSCGQALRASRAHWETSARALRASRAYWETTGDKYKIMRPEH